VPSGPVPEPASSFTAPVFTSTTDSEPVLQLAGVGVRRGAAWLLADATLAVRPGERWVVVGPNGAGKSTLLAVAATILLPTVGAVRVLGAALRRVDARTLRPRIGLTSAALAERFDPRLRAHEVVVTARTGALAPWWDTYAERDRSRARDLLRQLGVGDLAERTFGTLSTGERQRVLLARTLLPDPEIVLADEPAAGLDLRAREELVDALSAMAAQPRPAGIVLVTHHLEEIPPGFGHALVLAGGRVLAAGPIGAVLVDATLSAAYGIPLRIEGRDGRWTARRA
jgi:iron complex transport system ATP-binding protein